MPRELVARRPVIRRSLPELLDRLEAALATACDQDIYSDEINGYPPWQPVFAGRLQLRRVSTRYCYRPSILNTSKAFTGRSTELAPDVT